MANHTAQSSLPCIPGADSEAIPTSNRREGERIRARLRILVKAASEADPLQMRSLDVSTGGMFVAARDPLGLGTLVRLRKADALGVDGVGRVVWVRELQHSSRAEPPGMGIKFIRLSDQSKEDIEQLAKLPPEDPPEMLDAVDEVSAEPTPLPAALLPQTQPPGAPMPRAEEVLVAEEVKASSDHPPAGNLFEAVLEQMRQAALDAQTRAANAAPTEDGTASPARGHTMVCAYVESPASEQLSPALSASQTPHTLRHGAIALVGLYAVGALCWAVWPASSKAPRERATHAATAEAPREVKAEPTPAAVPEAPSPVVAALPQPEAAAPRELAALPHILRVETDPPGAWVVVAGQHARTPADIELRDYDGKRVALTVGAFQREQRLVHVLPSDFSEGDAAIRAHVKLKLKYTGKPNPEPAVGGPAAKPATSAPAQAAQTEQAAPHAQEHPPAAPASSAAPAAQGGLPSME